MRTVLVTTYAVNPYDGSEDRMGWNFIMQIARYQRVIAVTRPENKAAIERYLGTHPELKPYRQRIQFLYFDWPHWLGFGRKGSVLSVIHYYCWQLGLPWWLLRKRLQVDLVHNVNFHKDWTPTFLWILGKPLVWGPVGHNPVIPSSAIEEFTWDVQLRNRALWLIKKTLWKLDPFLWLSKRKATHILCMNQAAADVLNLPAHKYSIIPSVASESVNRLGDVPLDSGYFRILSVGRFEPLKGFTAGVKAFARFYHGLGPDEQQKVRLTLIGGGPVETRIRELVAEQGIVHCTDVIDWLPKANVAACYESASVLLFPSHEGAGMVVAEAMSYGLPVLCWDNEGPGRFVHPDSRLRVSVSASEPGIIQMANRLTDLFRQPDLYRHERQLAHQRFDSTFNWAIRGEQLKKVYQQISKGAVQPILPQSL